MSVTIEELLHQIQEQPEIRQHLADLLAMSRSKPQQEKMPYEEFLEWANEDTLAEWVNGEVIMHSPASYKHQDLLRFLVSLIGMYAETRHLGAICLAPFQMKLEHSGREPDLLFIAKEHLHRLKETYVEGPADLVVEIISPESISRDRGTKFYEYEDAGIPEYWLINPLRKWAEFYCLGEEGRYKIVFAGREGTYYSSSIAGFWLRVEWFWQEPLPNVMQAAWEIIGIEELRQVFPGSDKQPKE